MGSKKTYVFFPMAISEPMKIISSCCLIVVKRCSSKRALLGALFARLCHDSWLYSNMDPRQIAVLFKLVVQVCQKEGMQYICSLAEDQLLSVKECMQDEEYERVFGDDSIVLKLTDESDEARLLGIQVEIDLPRVRRDCLELIQILHIPFSCSWQLQEPI